jgi:hypothetical protein
VRESGALGAVEVGLPALCVVRLRVAPVLGLVDVLDLDAPQQVGEPRLQERDSNSGGARTALSRRIIEVEKKSSKTAQLDLQQWETSASTYIKTSCGTIQGAQSTQVCVITSWVGKLIEPLIRRAAMRDSSTLKPKARKPARPRQMVTWHPRPLRLINKKRKTDK